MSARVCWENTHKSANAMEIRDATPLGLGGCELPECILGTEFLPLPE